MNPSTSAGLFLSSRNSSEKTRKNIPPWQKPRECFHPTQAQAWSQHRLDVLRFPNILLSWGHSPVTAGHVTSIGENFDVKRACVCSHVFSVSETCLRLKTGPLFSASNRRKCDGAKRKNVPPFLSCAVSLRGLFAQTCGGILSGAGWLRVCFHLPSAESHINATPPRVVTRTPTPPCPPHASAHYHQHQCRS